MNLKIHHLGIKVRNIEKNIDLYEKMGYVKKSEIVIDEIQNNRIVFLRSGDGSQVLELIEPINDSSSIRNFANGFHHICYEVEGTYFFEEFKALKIGKIFAKFASLPAIANRWAAFGCLNNGMYVEFLIKEEICE